MDTFFGIVGFITVFGLSMKFLDWLGHTDFGFYLLVFGMAMYFVWIFWVVFINKK